MKRWMTAGKSLAVVLLACGGMACSRIGPTAPEPGPTALERPDRGVEPSARTQHAQGQVSAPQPGTSVERGIPAAARNLPIGKRTDPMATIGGVDTLPAAPAWYTVASSLVTPVLGDTVTGSRYRVIVPPLALDVATTISIREHSPDVLDFELLPHDTQFLLPVTVVVDYAGTSLDPASPQYDGGLPILLWLNSVTGRWELVPGVDNPLTKQYTVLLTHFSRYAVGRTSGTAEW